MTWGDNDQGPSPNDVASTRPLAKVTVIVTTYNHERYLAQALDSVLAQRSAESFDIVVIEDCSTDRTREIVLSYDRLHPGRFRLLLAERNQCDNAAFMHAVSMIRTPYVALLDGDDFWTSPDKLARQVDYLDAHPECAISHHAVMLVDDDGAELGTRAPTTPIATIDDLAETCFVTSCAAMIRRTAISPMPAWYVHEQSADWSLFLHASVDGTIDAVSGTMAAYRLHAGGFWTGRSRSAQLRRVIAFYEGWLARFDSPLRTRVATLGARAYLDLALESNATGDAEGATAARDAARRLEPDARRRSWTLRAAGRAAATVAFPTEAPTALQLHVTSSSPNAHDVQLNHRSLAVHRGRRYGVQLRLTAATPHRIGIGVAQSREPWTGLGWYHHATVAGTTKISTSFVATDDDPEARLHIDAGLDVGTVTIADVELLEQPQ